MNRLYRNSARYLVGPLFALDKTLSRLEQQLEGVEYDSLIGIGLGGALVVPTLAHKLGKPFAIVRKATDITHSSTKIEGEIGTRVVFVEDLISTGATRDYVKLSLDNLAPLSPFYGNTEFTPAKRRPVRRAAKRRCPSFSCFAP